MTIEEINNLLSAGEFPENCSAPKLVETHISWVILCDRYVYKIKKPVYYSFLDFSTLEKRKYYCEREIELNNRLSENIYLDIQPIGKSSNRFFIGHKKGEITDYAVRMRKLDGEKQMDVLLSKNKVTPADIQNLAEKIAAFHKSATIIYEKDYLDVQKKFNDLSSESGFLQNALKDNSGDIISCAQNISDKFIKRNEALLKARLKGGLFRDCHGDLHSRNIFLLPSPQPFDCIEFNDDYRQIDILNDIAFLCMDLDAFGRHDLSDLFLNSYNNLFPSIRTDEERMLFIYYKAYRANIRTKVNSLRARSAKTGTERKPVLAEAAKYLRLMDDYIHMLRKSL